MVCISVAFSAEGTPHRCLVAPAPLGTQLAPTSPPWLMPHMFSTTMYWRSKHGKTDFLSASSDARSSYIHLLQTPQADLRHAEFEGDIICGLHMERRVYLWCSTKSLPLPTPSRKHLHISLRAEGIQFLKATKQTAASFKLPLNY